MSRGKNARFAPVVEELDLKVDGSTPVQVPVTESYYRINRIIFSIFYDDNDVDWLKFGDADALTNGIKLTYVDKESVVHELFPSALKSNQDLAKFCYDMDIKTDDKTPKGNLIVARYTFSKFVGGGLPMDQGEEFYVTVQEDLTHTDYDNLTVIQICIEGENIVE